MVKLALNMSELNSPIGGVELCSLGGDCGLKKIFRKGRRD